MKVHLNKHLQMVLVAIAAFSCLSILPLASAAQSVTTASSAASTAALTPVSATTSHLMGNGVTMEDMKPEDYWKQVEGAPFKLTGKVRTYYVAAEEVVWDYAPDGFDKAFNKQFIEEPVAYEYTRIDVDRIGTRYWKCLYKEYTNSKFNVQKKRATEDEYLGFLGPVIKAEVGDQIKIVFLNKCRIPCSMHPHGIFYDKADEGAPYNDGTSGNNKNDDAILTGNSYTYIWNVAERCGPGPMDGSSMMWAYHSHTNEHTDFYAGLVGPIEITRKGMALADGSPLDVDRRIFLMFSVSNENNSPYLADSFKFSTAPPGSTPPTTNQGFVASNQLHTINGFFYGNGPMISMKKNDRVRWYVMSMGTFFDGHTPHWHGNTIVTNGMRMDVISMLAAEVVMADMCPENVGIWLFHCHVNDHLDDGMVTRFEVTNPY